MMAMKEYSAFSKSLALLEPHHQIVYIISKTLVGGGGLSPMPRCSWCIQQPLLTGPTAASNNISNIRTDWKTRKQKWKEKQICWYFKQLTDDIANEMTWRWLWKGNLKRETKSLLRATQNTIRTNYFNFKNWWYTTE